MVRRQAAAGEAVLAFVLCMAAVFPLFLHSGYFDLVQAKLFYFHVHLASFALLALVLCLLNKGKAPSGLHTPDKADLCLLAFAGACVLATLLSPHKQVAVWGLDDRRAGLVLWLGCVAAYFFITQLGGALPVRWFVYALLAGGSVVSLLAAANLLGFDPLRVYPLMGPSARRDFMSTIGNVDFVGGYLCLCLPAGLFGLAHTRRRGVLLFYGLASALCFVGLVAAGADGAWLGVAIATLLLCCRRDFTLRQLTRLLALAAVLLALAALLGLLYGLTGGGYHSLRGLSAVLARPLMLLPAALCAAIALLLRRVKAQDRPLYKAARILALALVLVAAALFVAVNLFGLRLGAVLEKLFLFGPEWGSRRGHWWQLLWRNFWHGQTLVQRLFGAGLDTVGFVLFPESAGATIMTGSDFDSAHNQLLQLLATTGILGLGTWLAALWQQLRGLLRWPAPLQSALGLCAVAYLVQAFFSIDLPVVLPLLFLILALGRVAGAQYGAEIAPPKPDKKRLLLLLIVECLLLSVTITLL